jgi:hypothetical protein
MSIATLKKKTQAKYNNNSVGERIFSLNGTRRSQGYVGQTSLSRSLPKTLMNGPTMRGHGGCCGTYYMSNIIQSAVTSLNDPNVVKSSTINTVGLLESKDHCVLGVDKIHYQTKATTVHTVKPDNNQNINNQSNYITNLAKQAIHKSLLDCNAPKSKTKTCCNKNPYLSRAPAYQNYTKPSNNYTNSIYYPNYGQYLTVIDNSCNLLDVKSVPNTHLNKAPLPGPGISK